MRCLETVLMPYASIALPFGEVLCERTFYCDRYPHDCARLRIHCTAIQKRRDTGASEAHLHSSFRGAFPL
jgi:hypothetical protein